MGLESKMKIKVFGNGWLGNHIANYMQARMSKEDICEVRRVDADIVVNAAGKTGSPNIDWCEKNRAETVRSNITGPLNLAYACQRSGAKLVHLSSGCLWRSSSRLMTEEDIPDPPSYYSFTKAKCDEVLSSLPVNSLIIRLRMPFNGENHPRNLINKITQYDKVSGELNSLTYVPDLLYTIKALISKQKEGIFNVVNSGQISNWEILDLMKMRYNKISKSELELLTLAPRSDCGLDTSKIESMSIHLPNVKQRIIESINIYKKKGN